MNRFRKPRPNEPSPMTPIATTAMSRTMRLAVSGMKVSVSSRGDDSGSNSTSLQRRGTWFSAPAAAAPRTKTEQYWAARALVAETLLSARDRHQDELAEMRRMEEQKREREIGTILHANDQRQRRLERLMVTCLAVLLGFMGWLVVMIAPDWGAKGKSNKPSHFTIPILSPFASVVEHETSVFGAKVAAILVLVIGIALYVALKHRLSQWPTR
ncbi:hypothetical protein J3R83DRAFT_13690 [Lanmaoa asiatica]|nr:hypothetical protein J3R83DRAFT_13690 [Lanmaoa asiatica]